MGATEHAPALSVIKQTQACFKKKSAQPGWMPRGSPAHGRCTAGTHGSIALVQHRRNVRARGRQKPFLVPAQADLPLSSVDPEVSRIRYPLGVKHTLTCTAELAPALRMVEPGLMCPVVVLKKK